MIMTTFKENLHYIQSRIQSCAKKANRSPKEISLVAVSKKQAIDKIKTAYNLGLRHFAENYVQEFSQKFAALKELTDIQWHYIGSIQSNKTRFIASHAQYVHSLCSEKIAHRLNAQRPSELAPLKVFIQINLAQETTKPGLALEELNDFVDLLQPLKQLELIGLMCLPPATNEQAEQLFYFNLMKQTLLNLNKTGYNLKALSMGTSQDFESAILAGATMLRLGTILFGPRI